MLHIVLDTREDALKNLLKHTHFVVKQLHVGDIHFVDEADEVKLIFERKTATDLFSSIASSRFREQRERLKRMCQQNIKVCYIIENFPGSLDFTKRKVALGALENLVLYHNMFVLHTSSLDQTATCLCNMLKKANEKAITSLNDFETSVVLGQTSKRTLADQNVFPNMLVQIHGVSDTTAKVIADRYGSIPQLLSAWSAEPDSVKRSRMLADIQLGKRRLGNVLSERIYKVFCESEETINS